jgi:hypothetical protein
MRRLPSALTSRHRSTHASVQRVIDVERTPYPDDADPFYLEGVG